LSSPAKSRDLTYLLKAFRILGTARIKWVE
jgi:hypothetical protein